MDWGWNGQHQRGLLFDDGGPAAVPPAGVRLAPDAMAFVRYNQTTRQLEVSVDTGPYEPILTGDFQPPPPQPPPFPTAELAAIESMLTEANLALAAILGQLELITECPMHPEPTIPGRLEAIGASLSLILS